MALDGETVRLGAARAVRLGAGTLDGQLGARADVMEMRVVRWGKPAVEPGVQ